jgi:hypothetical protein
MKYKLLVFDDVVRGIATQQILGSVNRQIEVIFLLLRLPPLLAVLFLLERT